MTANAIAMFRQMDGGRGLSYVQWSDLLDFLMREMTPSTLRSDVRHLSVAPGGGAGTAGDRTSGVRVGGTFRAMQHTKRQVHSNVKSRVKVKLPPRIFPISDGFKVQ